MGPVTSLLFVLDAAPGHHVAREYVVDLAVQVLSAARDAGLDQVQQEEAGATTEFHRAAVRQGLLGGRGVETVLAGTGSGRRPRRRLHRDVRRQAKHDVVFDRQVRLGLRIGRR